MARACYSATQKGTSVYWNIYLASNVKHKASCLCFDIMFNRSNFKQYFLRIQSAGSIYETFTKLRICFSNTVASPWIG